jgi:DNA polymerase III delta prime subunit
MKNIIEESDTNIDAIKPSDKSQNKNKNDTNDKNIPKLDIHNDIKKKLKYFIEIKKIPNIIFHGVSGCGKNTLVNNFIHDIYHNDKEMIKNYVMEVNCAHGKGIKFIREELKFFAKTNINLKDGEIFKTIILLNADKLTIDAQSALRRCIELFSHSTRFFIIVEDKYKLLKPILSRFCEIYVPEPIVNGKVINLHSYALSEIYSLGKVIKKKMDNLKKDIKLDKKYTLNELISLCVKLYENGYSCLDIISFIRNSSLEESKIYEFMVIFNKIKKDFRNEKLLMLFILNFFLFRSDSTLENISFM